MYQAWPSFDFASEKVSRDRKSQNQINPTIYKVRSIISVGAPAIRCIIINYYAWIKSPVSQLGRILNSSENTSVSNLRRHRLQDERPPFFLPRQSFAFSNDSRIQDGSSPWNTKKAKRKPSWKNAILQLGFEVNKQSVAYIVEWYVIPQSVAWNPCISKNIKGGGGRRSALMSVVPCLDCKYVVQGSAWIAQKNICCHKRQSWKSEICSIYPVSKAAFTRLPFRVTPACFLFCLRWTWHQGGLRDCEDYLLTAKRTKFRCQQSTSPAHYHRKHEPVKM